MPYNTYRGFPSCCQRSKQIHCHAEKPLLSISTTTNNTQVRDPEQKLLRMTSCNHGFTPLCHAELDSRSRCLSDKNGEIPNQVWNDNCFGFTLIELLIVVLIIGILAAIALPQYQRAVEKFRATQALTLLKSLGEAQESYYLANGEYATRFDKLDVKLPEEFQPGGTFFTYQTTDNHTNNEWVINIVTETGVTGAMYMGHPQGHPYAGAGFLYTPNIVRQKTQHAAGNIYCTEIISHGVIFKGQAGDYCQKLFGGGENLCNGCAIRKYKIFTK